MGGREITPTISRYPAAFFMPKTTPTTMQELTPFEQHIAAILESVYHTPVSDSKTEAGFDSPREAVMSRDTCTSERGIFSSEPDLSARPCLARAGSLEARAGKPQGLPELPRSVNPVRAASCLTAEGGVAKPKSEVRAMTQTQITGTSIANHIAVVDGQLTTTTHNIAKVYGKRHDNVLAIVRARIADAGEWGVLNFKETPYTDPQNGQAYQVIQMTKKGFHFVVGKFTGAKAVQHQIAFADEFERMEQELRGQQAPAQRPYNPALDYERISPAQAQDIKELVHMVVESGVQGFPDTWGRLHKKFRVNSYLELPATRYEEVCSYLRAKFPKAYRLKDAELPFAEDDSIDVATLLLSGQSDPKPLTPAQHALIDQAAGRLVGEAYPLIRAHLERRVSWNTNAAQRQSGDVEVVQQVLSAATLGNCLAHHLHSEAQSVRLLLQAMRQRIDGVLGSHEQPLGLAH